jgi:hypothetical protein
MSVLARSRRRYVQPSVDFYGTKAGGSRRLFAFWNDYDRKSVTIVLSQRTTQYRIGRICSYQVFSSDPSLNFATVASRISDFMRDKKVSSSYVETSNTVLKNSCNDRSCIFLACG